MIRASALADQHVNSLLTWRWGEDQTRWALLARHSLQTWHWRNTVTWQEETPWHSTIDCWLWKAAAHSYGKQLYWLSGTTCLPVFLQFWWVQSLVEGDKGTFVGIESRSDGSRDPWRCHSQHGCNPPAKLIRTVAGADGELMTIHSGENDH